LAVEILWNYPKARNELMAAAPAVDVTREQEPIVTTTKMSAIVGMRVPFDNHHDITVVLIVLFVMLVVLVMPAVPVAMVFVIIAFVILVLVIVMARKRPQMHRAAHGSQHGQSDQNCHHQHPRDECDRFHGASFSLVVCL
jgi:Ca2+/Na+ antiporter